jgi:hypothetical protein
MKRIYGRPLRISRVDYDHAYLGRQPNGYSACIDMDTVREMRSDTDEVSRQR